MHYLFEPGLLSSGPVRTALLVGAVVAVTSGVIGVFTVLRGQSFAGHSLAERVRHTHRRLGRVPGRGEPVLGVPGGRGRRGGADGNDRRAASPGTRRGHRGGAGRRAGERNGLFLYLGTLQTATTGGASFTVLFDSIFVISPDTVPALVASGAVALLVVAVLARVLLLTSVSPELAQAQGDQP